MLLAHPRPLPARGGAAARARRHRAAARRVHDRRVRWRPARVIWGADNVFKAYTVSRGRRRRGVGAGAALIVEGEYETGAQEQLYIEPNGMIAVADPGARRHGLGLDAVPVLHPQGAGAALRPARATRSASSRWRPAAASAARKSIPSMIAGHAALLAWKSGRPVKMIYDRAEDMAATTKRHPSRTRHRTAVDADGKLLAMDIDFVIDGGAYCTLVAGRALARHDPRGRAVPLPERAHPRPRGRDQRAAARRVPRLRRAAEPLRARAPHGPRRRGASASTPDELRRRNFITAGQTHAPPARRSREPVDMRGAARPRAGAVRTTTRSARASRARTPGRVRQARHRLRRLHARRRLHRLGRGCTSRRSSASRRTADGRVRVLAASTEIGQGTNTIFSQIAADALGIDYDRHRRRRSPTPRSSRTAGRPSPRAPAWSSASWSRRRRSALQARC